MPTSSVTAVCDVWKERRDATLAKYKDTAKGYGDYRELLAQKDVDAVIIASPPHWHALMAIDACEAGKDIYLQKPMTLYLGESLAVKAAVKKHKRICQVGTQIHAGENYHKVVDHVRSGNLGPISVARTFNVMNLGPEGIGNDPNCDPPPGWIGDCGSARARCGRSIRWSSRTRSPIRPSWRTAAAGRRAGLRTSSTCPSGPSIWGCRRWFRPPADATCCKTRVTFTTLRRRWCSTPT